MAQAHEFLQNEGVLASEFVFLSCGDFDGRTLKKESKFKNFAVPSYMKRWINIKKVFPADFDMRFGDSKEKNVQKTEGSGNMKTN